MHWLPVETGPGPRVSSLSVQTQGWGVGWMEREVKERKRRGKLDPKTGNCLSFLEMQNQAYADVSIKA